MKMHLIIEEMKQLVENYWKIIENEEFKWRIFMENGGSDILNRNLTGFRFKNLTTANFSGEFSYKMIISLFKIGFLGF